MIHLLSGLRATDKGALLAELARHAAKATGVDAADIARRLAAREALGSTGIGGRVVVPHARLAELSVPAAFFARLDRPIAFDAIDGAPVDLVFLLLSPEGADATHLAWLAAASRRLRDPALVAAIRAARGPAEIAAALGELPAAR
jgi:PTS system nitrogen regulatory IIA component